MQTKVNRLKTEKNRVALISQSELAIQFGDNSAALEPLQCS